MAHAAHRDDDRLREVNDDIARQEELERASIDALLEANRTVRMLQHEELVREKEELERILGYVCHVYGNTNKRND